MTLSSGNRGKKDKKKQQPVGMGIEGRRSTERP
jgi:hypothetical protein